MCYKIDLQNVKNITSLDRKFDLFKSNMLATVNIN